MRKESVIVMAILVVAVLNIAYIPYTESDAEDTGNFDVDGQDYSSLQDAITAASNGGTIKVENGSVSIASASTVASGSIVTLDLNGQTINTSSSGRITVESGGTLTVKDSVGNGTITGNVTRILDVYGKATLESGSIHSTGGYTVQVRADGEFLMSGGTISNVSNTGIYAQGKLTITGGTIIMKEKSPGVVGTGTSIDCRNSNITIGTSDTCIELAAIQIRGYDIDIVNAVFADVKSKFSPDEDFSGCSFRSDVTDMLPAGLMCEYSESTGLWTVTPVTEETTVAMIGDTRFSSLPVAFSNLKDGQTLEVQADYDGSDLLKVTVFNATVNLNGHSINSKNTSMGYAIYVNPSGNNPGSSLVRIVNDSETTSVITGDVPICASPAYSNQNLYVSIEGNITLTPLSDEGSLLIKGAAAVRDSELMRQYVTTGGVLAETESGDPYIFGTLSYALYADADKHVTILNDFEGSLTVSRAGTYSIDLNGKTVTTAGNGLSVEQSGIHIMVSNGSIICGTDGTGNGIEISDIASNSSVTLEDVNLSFGGIYGIHTNGTTDDLDISMTRGSITYTGTSQDAYGVFFPSQGSATFDGVTITAPNGLQFCGDGDLVVKDCTITATGQGYPNGPQKDPSEGDGPVMDGAAISIISRGNGYNYDGTDAGRSMSVNIEGGTYISENNSPIQSYRYQKVNGSWVSGESTSLKSYIGSIIITDGTFKSDASGTSAISFDDSSVPENSDVAAYEIYGGTFGSSVDSRLLADGFSATQNSDGDFVVGLDPEETPVAELDNGKRFPTLQQAIDAATPGQTVKLLTAITEQVVVSSGDVITLDLNGQTITYADNTTNTAGVITNNGSLTIIDYPGGGSITAQKGIAIYATAGSYTKIGGGSFISQDVGSGYSRALSSSGQVLITGGSFTSNGYSGAGDNYTNAIAITNLNNDNQDASLTIRPEGGSSVTVTSKNDYAVSSRYGADVYIHGGTFGCEGLRPDVYCFEAGGDFIIYGGTFTHEPYSEYIAENSFVYKDGDVYTVDPITVIVETTVHTYDELEEALSDLSRPIHVVIGSEIEIPADKHIVVGNGFVLDLGGSHLIVNGILTLDGDIVASNGGYMDVNGFVENILKLQGIDVNGMPGASGDGYHITNAMDLQWLAYYYEYGGSDIFDTIFLDNDISLPGGVTFTPIGTEANPVGGILFDGGGHTISNLHVEPTTEYTGGLFGTIYDSTVMDLTINGSGTNSTSSYIGAVAGYVAGTTTFSNVTVENFTLYSPISFGVGGFVGQIYGDSDDRVEFVSCSLRNVDVTGNSNVGSFWGTSTGYPGTVGVYNCVLDDVTVAATNVNGGIVAGYGNSAIVDIIALSQTDVSVTVNGQPSTSYVAHTTTNPNYDHVDATRYTAIKGSEGWTAVEGKPQIVATVNGSPYTDFEAALAAAAEKELILQADIDGSFELPSGVTLDLNGHTITGSSDASVITTPDQPNGNTIIDSSEGMTGRVVAAEGQSAISVLWAIDIRGGNIIGDIDVTEGVDLGIFAGFVDGSIVYDGDEQIRIYGGQFTERPQQEWLSSRYFPLPDEDSGIYMIVEATTVSWSIYTIDGVESGQFVVPLGYAVTDFYADQIPGLPEGGADYAYHWIANGTDDWDWSTTVDEDPYVRSLCEYELTISASNTNPYVGQTVTLTVGDNSGLDGLYYYGQWYTYDSSGEPVPMDVESSTLIVTTSGTYGYTMTVRNNDSGYQIGNGLGEIVVTFRQSGGGGGNPGGGTTTPDPDEETETVTNPDGSTTTTTTRPDGSSTVETTRPDGSSTVVDERPVTGGTQTTVTDTDADGNTTSTTTTVTETTTSTGSTVSSTTVETTDAEGNTTSTTDSTYVSADESTVTNVTVFTDAEGNTAAQTSTVVSVSPSEEGRVTVTSDAISDAVSQIDDATSDIDAAEKVITVQPSGDTQQSVSVVMEPDAIRSIADTGATLEIAGDVGTISASTEVSGTLAQQTGSVSISIQVADKEQMAPVQQEAVGDRTTYQLMAVSDEGEIHELGGQVTVTVPYELSAGEIRSSIIVYYVDDDGQMHAMPTTYENGIVTFTTTHFSYYTIHSEFESDAPASDDDGGDTLLYVGVAIVVIAIIAVAAVALRHRF